LSKKKKAAPVVSPPTKRQLSRWQKQKRQQRIIFGIASLVIAAVLILVGSGVFFGWYMPVYRPLHATVLEIGGTSYPMNYFVDYLQYQIGNTIDSYLGGDWSYAAWYMDYVVDSLQNDVMVRQAADRLGISISEAEIDKYLEGHPEIKNRALRDIAYSVLLYQKLSDEYFAPQLPENPEQRQILAMLLESRTQIDQVLAELEAGADFGTLAEELSLNEATRTNKGDLGFHPREVVLPLFESNNEDLAELIFSQEVGAFGWVEDANFLKSVGYWIIKITEIDEEFDMVRFSGMLLGTEEEALALMVRLDEGEDFSELAQEYSQVWDSAGGDDMGWFTAEDAEAGYIPMVLADYIFDPDTQIEVAALIKDEAETETTGAYWFIQIAAEENRPLSDDDRNTMIDQLFSDWMVQVQENAADGIFNYLDEDRQTWVVDYLTGALK